MARKRRHPSERAPSSTDSVRRRTIATIGVAAAGAMSRESMAAGESGVAVPRRALTGRDDAGKSVFKSFDVTPQVVTFASRPGVAFYELYATAGVPSVTGHEPDPMISRKGAFPAPGRQLVPDGAIRTEGVGRE